MAVPAATISIRLKSDGARLVEVRVTKVGADFSGNAEGCVDRD